LDVSLHYLQIGDIPDPWDLTIYFNLEQGATLT
jgi:hypothetical protein